MSIKYPKWGHIKKQTDMAVLLKPKLIVWIGISQKNSKPNPNPKNSPKSANVAPIWSNKEQKEGWYFKNWNWESTLVGPKNVYEPDVNHKNSPEAPKKR